MAASLQYRVNGAAPMIKTALSVGISAAGASAFTAQVFTVSGFTTDMIPVVAWGGDHSAGLFIGQAQVLSTNNVQVQFFNNTGTSITQAGTTLRFTSQ